ncbi:hypothetical protein Ocin01_17969 [Orchesella cincta]|uniref:Uncharacterized protein n=1 Tax=Orchesella cincta TaxID=48709 RepID=A0A1D2M6V2_ORCCI|nr:hypothetical protein Ocin01_17969 [Orchesella cincta]
MSAGQLVMEAESVQIIQQYQEFSTLSILVPVTQQVLSIAKWRNDTGNNRNRITAAFLKSKYNSMTFADCKFLDRSKGCSTPTTVYRSTGTVPNESIGLPWVIYHGTLESQTCVLYLSSPSPELVIFKCIDATNTSVLCQT